MTVEEVVPGFGMVAGGAFVFCFAGVGTADVAVGVKTEVSAAIARSWATQWEVNSMSQALSVLRSFADGFVVRFVGISVIVEQRILKRLRDSSTSLSRKMHCHV